MVCLSDLVITWNEYNERIREINRTLDERQCKAIDCSECYEKECIQDRLYREQIDFIRKRDKIEHEINTLLETGGYTISDVMINIETWCYVNTDTPISYEWDYEHVPHEWENETCYYLTTSGNNVPTLETEMYY